MLLGFTPMSGSSQRPDSCAQYQVVIAHKFCDNHCPPSFEAFISYSLNGHYFMPSTSGFYCPLVLKRKRSLSFRRMFGKCRKTGLGDGPTTGKASPALFQAWVASPWKNEGVSFSSVSLGVHFKRIHKMTKKGLLKKNSPEFSAILQTCWAHTIVSD